MKFVSITRLRLRSWRFLPWFLWLSFRSNAQAQQAPGNLKTQLLWTKKLVFWTMTLWENEADMRAFMRSGAHGRAMPKLVNWCNEAALVHWLQAETELPTLAEAHSRMLTEGRFSKVRYPSSHQQAQHIPAPLPVSQA